MRHRDIEHRDIKFKCLCACDAACCCFSVDLCRSKSCVALTAKCDGLNDCSGNSDEWGCPYHSCTAPNADQNVFQCPAAWRSIVQSFKAVLPVFCPNCHLHSERPLFIFFSCIHYLLIGSKLYSIKKNIFSYLFLSIKNWNNRQRAVTAVTLLHFRFLPFYGLKIHFRFSSVARLCKICVLNERNVLTRVVWICVCFGMHFVCHDHICLAMTCTSY